jgi:hypothetical protein
MAVRGNLKRSQNVATPDKKPLYETNFSYVQRWRATQGIDLQKT